MADIKQEIGLDASKAINELVRLEKQFDNTNRSLSNFASTMKGFNGLNPAKQMITLSNAVKQTTQSTERLTVSWGLLARVVTTQAIVASFGKFRRELAESVTDAVAFGDAISKVQVIANGSLGSLDNLSAEVRKISDAFGIDLVDAADGLEELVSSQLANNGAEGFKLLASTAELATAGFVSMGTAGKVLNGTINAFGFNASDADAIASKLFKTVDLGTISFDQLAGVFNRTSAQAKLIGVTVEEQAAFFAAATNSGQGYSETATLLSGVLTSLQKPTVAMTEAMRTLGFSNSQALISTLGLGEGIKQLIGTTDGSAESINKLVPNVRGLRGALQLGQGFEKFNDFLKQIEETSDDLVKKKSLEVLSTDAGRFRAEAQKLTSLLTVDFGTALLRAGVSITDLTGGVDNLKAVLAAGSTAGPVIAATTAALLAYSAAAIKGSIATKALIASSAPGFVLAAGSFAAGGFIGDELLAEIAAPRKAFDEEQTRLIASLKKASDARLKVQSEADDKLVKKMLVDVQQLNKTYLQDVDNLENAGILIKKNAERITTDVLNARKRLVDGIRTSIMESDNLIRGSQGRITGLQDRQSDRDFTQDTKGLNNAQKVFKLIERANDLSNQAVKNLKSGDPAAAARGLELFNRAQTSGDIAAAIAERTGNRSLEFRAAQALTDLTSKQIVSEKQLQTIQASRQKNLDVLSKRQAEILSSVGEQTQIIRENSQLTDSAGNLLPADDIAARSKKITDALAKIRKSNLSPQELKKFQDLGLGAAAQAFNQKLAFQGIELEFNVTSGIAKVQAELRKSFQTFKLNLDFDSDLLGQALGKELKTPDEVTRAISEAKTQVQELRKGFGQIGTDDASIKKLRTEILGTTAQAENLTRELLRMVRPGGGGSAVGVTQDVNSISTEINQLAKSASITDEQLKGLLQRVAKLGDENISKGGLAKNVGAAVDVSELSTAIGLLKQIQTIQQSQSTNPALQQGAQQRLQLLNRALEAERQMPAALQGSVINMQQLGILTNTYANAQQRNTDSVFQAIPALTFSNNIIAQYASHAVSVAQSLNQAAIAMTQLAAASQNVKPIPGTQPQSSGDPTQNAAFGGYFAHGGRGTDTIPAMLSPGETVIDSRNSQKFFSELQAIRAGAAPRFQSGGVVNNHTTQVGDITIKADRGEDIVSIGNKLKRAIRRGTINL